MVKSQVVEAETAATATKTARRMRKEQPEAAPQEASTKPKPQRKPKVEQPAATQKKLSPDERAQAQQDKTFLKHVEVLSAVQGNRIEKVAQAAGWLYDNGFLVDLPQFALHGSQIQVSAKLSDTGKSAFKRLTQTKKRNFSELSNTTS